MSIGPRIAATFWALVSGFFLFVAIVKAAEGVNLSWLLTVSIFVGIIAASVATFTGRVWGWWLLFAINSIPLLVYLSGVLLLVARTPSRGPLAVSEARTIAAIFFILLLATLECAMLSSPPWRWRHNDC